MRLDKSAPLAEGGITGLALVPGDPDQSYLMQRLLGQGNEDRMPLKAQPLGAQDRLPQFRSAFAQDSASLGGAMRTETLKVIEEIAFDGDRDFREIFDTRATAIAFARSSSMSCVAPPSATSLNHARSNLNHEEYTIWLATHWTGARSCGEPWAAWRWRSGWRPSRPCWTVAAVPWRGTSPCPVGSGSFSGVTAYGWTSGCPRIRGPAGV